MNQNKKYMKNHNKNSYRDIRNRKLRESFCSIGGKLCVISLLLIFTLQLLNSGYNKILEGVITIIVNLLCSYLAACVFYILMDLIPEARKEAVMRPKVFSCRNQIEHSILRCINAMCPFDFKPLNEPHKTRKEFVEEFGKENIGKDDKKTLDAYLGVLQLNREKIRLLVDSLLLIREYLSVDEIKILYQIKDSLFLSESICLIEYVEIDEQPVELPNSNQREIGESIYNIYEQIKVF